MLMGKGLASTLGQLRITQGYQNAPAADVGIFTYTEILHQNTSTNFS